MSNRAPSGSATRSVVPASRQAAGASSAWSQPSPLPPRDHADGATLGRWDAKRHSGPEGRCFTSHLPRRPTVSRTRESNRFETDGQAGRPPPQSGPEHRVRRNHPPKKRRPDGGAVCVIAQCRLWCRVAPRRDVSRLEAVGEDSGSYAVGTVEDLEIVDVPAGVFDHR